MISELSHLIEIMSECRCIVINILNQYCNVSLSLVLAVCCSDSQGVPRLLLKVQRSSECYASTVAMNTKFAWGCWVQLQGVGQGRTGVDIITRHKSDLCANQHIWQRERDYIKKCFYTAMMYNYTSLDPYRLYLVTFFHVHLKYLL